MRALLVCVLLASSGLALAKPVPEKFPGAILPDVTKVQDTLGGRSGVVDREKGKGTLAVASPTGIIVAGKVIVKIDQGAVDPAKKEGGESGNKIPDLAAALPGTDLAELGIDRSLTYKVLFEMLYSGKTSGRSNFALLVMAGGSVMAVPIVLPTKKVEGDAVKMIVSVSKTELLQYSLSGKEGTLKKPLLRIALDDKTGDLGRSTAAMNLRTSLGTVVKKRWKGKRPEATQSIILMCDGGTPIQFVADLMVAIRPHFSNIVLSAGFE